MQQLEMPNWLDDSVLGTLGILAEHIERECEEVKHERTLLLFTGLRLDSRFALGTYIAKHQPGVELVSACELRKHWHMLDNRREYVMADNLDPALFRHAPFIRFADGSYGCGVWVSGPRTDANLGLLGVECECRRRALGRYPGIYYAVCPEPLLRDFAQQYVVFGDFTTLGDGTLYQENPSRGFVGTEDDDGFEQHGDDDDDFSQPVDVELT